MELGVGLFADVEVEHEIEHCPLQHGAGAMLQRAMLNFMLDLHVGEQAYTELHTPYMVREEIMYGSGQLPKFRDNLYHDDEENLWLIPTSEVPLVNLYLNQ